MLNRKLLSLERSMSQLSPNPSLSRQSSSTITFFPPQFSLICDSSILNLETFNIAFELDRPTFFAWSNCPTQLVALSTYHVRQHSLPLSLNDP